MRKRVKLLAALLVACVTGAFAQFDANKTYVIVNNADAGRFMQDNGTGGVALAEKNNNSYWKFVATANTDCYYIQNAKTGKYIQGYTASEQEVATGDAGVEYYVKADATGSYSGKFRMSCTANSPHDFSDGTLGLNWKDNNTVQSFASLAGSNPRSAWTVTQEDMPEPAPSLSSPWVGSDVAEGEFYLYNVESGLWLQNNDSKMHDWSTRGAIGTRGLNFTLSGSEGNYTIGANFGSASINPDNNYLDTGNNPAWAFQVKNVEGITNAYTITCGNKVLGTVNYNENGKQNNLFTQEGDNRWYLENPDFNINMMERNTWQLVSKAERLAKMKKEASPENPIDASWLIPSADFANNDRRFDLWTKNFTQRNNLGNLVRGGDANDDITRGSMIIESWHSETIDMYTTIVVPNGTYKLTVQGYYRDGDRSEVISRRNAGTETIRSYYYANEVSHPFMSILDGAKTEKVNDAYDYNEGGYWYPDQMAPANRCFNLHKGYVNEEIEVEVTEGLLKIGVVKESGVDSDWTVFDNFHLTYLGNNIDLSELTSTLDNAISQAEDWDASNTSDVLKQNLADVIADAKSKLSSTDADELSDAIVAVNSALEAAKAVDVSVLRQTIAVAESGIDVTAANNACANAMTKAEVDNALYDLQTARKLNALRMPDIYTGSAPAAGEFYLYNIGTGLWLNHGSDWNTHGAIDIYGLPVTLVAADEGKFKLQTHMFAGYEEKYIDWNLYVDTDAQNTWTFNPVEGKTNVYTINSEGNRTDVGRLMGYDPYGPTDRGDYKYWTTVAKDRENVNNPNNQWKLVSRSEIESLMDAASESKPVDASFYIYNGGLSRVWGLDKWTKVCDGGNGGAHITVGDNGEFNRNSDYGYEVFDANSFSFTQELTGLKPGNYEVGVNGFFRQGDGGFQAGVVNDNGELISEAYLVANEEKAFLPNIATEAGKMPGIFSQNSNNGTFANWPAEALHAFETGLYKTSVKVVANTDGKLTIGVKQDQKTTNGSWVLFDSFRLTYLGPVAIERMDILGDFTGGWEFPESGKMTQDANNPAIWTLTIDRFYAEAKQYDFKATANEQEGIYELPAKGKQNFEFGTEKYPVGYYKLVFTVNTNTHELTLDVKKRNEVTISEDADNKIVNVEDAVVTLNRTFKNDEAWNTFVVPFNISNSELKRAFGEDVAVAEYSEDSADPLSVIVRFDSMKEPAVTANVPVLLKTDTDATEFVFDADVIEETPVKEGKYFDFVGSYSDQITIDSGDYFLKNNTLFKSEGESTLKGTRAYLKAKTAEARIANIVFDEVEGVVTGITEISSAKVSERIYNLSGQEVNTIQRKGLYIKGGKKVIK